MRPSKQKRSGNSAGPVGWDKQAPIQFSVLRGRDSPETKRVVADKTIFGGKVKPRKGKGKKVSSPHGLMYSIRVV